MLRVVSFLILSGLASAALITEGRWFAPLLLLPAIVGPWGIVVSGSLLRLAYIGTGASDNMLVVDAARDRIFAGLSPYGVGYEQSIPPGAPFPYGPLMLVDSIPLEVIASVLILGLLAWYRRYWTLAFFAGLPPMLFLASSGNTDMLPTLLLAAGLLVEGPAGSVLLGLSVAVKPYTAVFLPLAAVFPLAVGVAVAAYVPAAWWGGLPESMAMLSRMQDSSAWRWVAFPLSLGAFRWPLLASAAFVALTMTSGVWSWGYLAPLTIAVGVTLEREIVNRTAGVAAGRRNATASSG